MKKVLIYNEFCHEQENDNEASKIYPEGIHMTLKRALEDEFSVETVTLETVNEITEEKLQNTDVLLLRQSGLCISGT